MPTNRQPRTLLEGDPSPFLGRRREAMFSTGRLDNPCGSDLKRVDPKSKRIARETDKGGCVVGFSLEGSRNLCPGDISKPRTFGVSQRPAGNARLPLINRGMAKDHHTEWGQNEAGIQ